MCLLPQGCAQALGLVSSVHLDPVLAKLDQVARAELTKKPTGLLGFMKDTKVRSAGGGGGGSGGLVICGELWEITFLTPTTANERIVFLIAFVLIFVCQYRESCIISQRCQYFCSMHDKAVPNQ